MKDGLTEPLRVAIARHLDADGQVLVYLNRRGFAPSLLCTACGELVECRRCDARLVLHRQRGKLVCHHCGAERPIPDACDACGEAELIPVGQGTERLEAALAELYPGRGIVRIDRDTTRRRGEIGRKLEQVRSGEAQILLGTQMLTKGHDFPNVTLVCIIDADQGLFGTDFRAGERLAQSFVQVSGRAGRGERPGEVYIQTLFPDHPLLNKLIAEGYGSFARAAMAERRQAGWPPFAYLALMRAEAPQRDTAFEFLGAASDLARELITADGMTGLRILGPAPAPMERRSGRYRGQLLIHADTRADLHRFLGALAHPARRLAVGPPCPLDRRRRPGRAVLKAQNDRLRAVLLECAVFMKTQIEQLVAAAIAELPGIADQADAAAVPVEIERTRDRQHGDYACNVAMRLAKPLRDKPRDIAQAIVERIPVSDLVESIEIAGPGFINFHLSAAAFHRELADVIERGKAIRHQ